MKLLYFEQKIMGINVLWIYTAITACFVILAYFGGKLLTLSYLGFEVVFPFLIAIAVGEWGKTRADTNFEIIAAQSNSLFRWVSIRFVTVFATGSIFAIINMIIVSLIRNETPVWEMVLLYFPSTFFLSSVCALCSLCFAEDHIATLICGVLWIVSMLARSLLRVPGVEYIYLFIKYAGDLNGIWIINKTVLTLLGLLLWIVTYMLCKKRVFMR